MPFLQLSTNIILQVGLYRNKLELIHVLSFFLEFLTIEDGADRFYRNVGTELPVNAT
jgi:hypothetical protein